MRYAAIEPAIKAVDVLAAGEAPGIVEIMLCATAAGSFRWAGYKKVVSEYWQILGRQKKPHSSKPQQSLTGTLQRDETQLSGASGDEPLP